ncbi:CDP-ribitol ribitolphosphotransferase [Lederbergia galactosidilyticus]|uniref:CDP-glycerol glycerophosphotransferase family protein n=1 Tax=Lederbergia galactosidilytica TaxID=217031 RepID=UPI001E0B761B|nr:CDP-glycerol glycerophosphotransferase family protein [Lederbergia galactosidilytica]MBP1915467.1 CDP-ribitol ribitolphosphotransferase [Lederbergia galactosidilytica]
MQLEASVSESLRNYKENTQHEFYETENSIIDLKWNESILSLKGYCYIKGIPLTKSLNVRKSLLLEKELMNEEEEVTFNYILEDIPIDELNVSESFGESLYFWAGYKGSINFSTAHANKPLPPGLYKTYIKIEILQNNQVVIEEKISLGDIRKFLKNDFHTAQLKFFSAKLQIENNLMVTYDLDSKSMLLESIKVKSLNPSLLYGDIKNKTERPGILYRILRSKVFVILYYFFNLLPVKEKRILFASDSRDEIGGNLMFVYEEMLRRELDYEYKFMFKENSFVKKSLTEIVQLAYFAATSKFILLEENYPMFSPLKIKAKTELIQLWHGAGAFKKFGYSRLGQPGGPKVHSKDHRNYTKAVVSSKHIISHYSEGFDISPETIYPLGIPRTDIFFDEEYKRQKRAELYEQYPFLKDKKVILFAPTFRGKGRKEAHYPIEVLNFQELYENLKDDYVFLFKLHFIVLNKINIPYQYADFFYDFSDYREVNDLLLIADLLITDYSSICFEFSLLDKPMLFFAHDVEEYISTRGFYYGYQSFIPGKLVKTSKQLVEHIKNNDFGIEKVLPFREYFFDDLDGKASKRIVDQLILNSGEQETQ